MTITKADLENVFGPLNIAAWADLDNDANPATIAARIAYAIELATEYSMSKIRLLTYAPSASVIDHIMVKHATVQKAGDLLYSPPAISDAEPGKDLLSKHRKEYQAFWKEVAAGQVDLGLTQNCRPYPGVLDESTGEVGLEGGY